MTPTNPQALATSQGKHFEQHVAEVLQTLGWLIEDTNVTFDGVEIDIVATSPGGVRWWIECKGSWRGERPGLIRSDTTKKAVAVAYHLHHNPADLPPYMVVTTHLPESDSSAGQMLSRAVKAGAIETVVVVSELRGVS